MKNFARIALSLAASLSLASLASGAAFAGTTTAPTQAQKAKDSFQIIHLTELKSLMAKTVAIYDANGQETRTTTGMIPGAHPLSSHGTYNVKKELPESKSTPLVFYCANTECMASHAAAERAVGAGYTNVSVFADGIQGWVKAGQPVEKLKIN